jgi:hypothetical protein
MVAYSHTCVNKPVNFFESIFQALRGVSHEKSSTIVQFYFHPVPALRFDRACFCEGLSWLAPA